MTMHGKLEEYPATSVADTALIARPESVEEAGEAIRTASGRVLPRGGGSKPALSTPPPDEASHAPATLLDLSHLQGILEYNPSEFTFTARAGTRLAEIIAALAEHGQAMPFDPPFVDAGATLGGAIAAGLSGPRRVRYGGLRDFILGVRFLDGRGTLVRGGGRVVKNAAGLDLSRLMVGSMGRLGVLTEATFKVFPSPPSWATVRIPCATVQDGADLLQRLVGQRMEFEGLELAAEEPAVYARLGGLSAVMSARVQQLIGACGGESLPEDGEAEFWRKTRDVAWAANASTLVRVGMGPQHLVALDAGLRECSVWRRYGAGGHVAWVALDGAENVDALHALLVRHGLADVVVRGSALHPILGARSGQALLARVRRVFDPDNRFFDL